MARKNFDITPEQVKDFQEATLMDDDFMREFFRDNIPATQTVLRIIMDKPGLIVKSVSVQHNLPGLDEFHGVRFDVYAVDYDGTQYDIEFQNDADGADPHRADFNCAMMTVRTLEKGENFSVLEKRERVVIFITKTDVLKGKEPIYRIKRVIRELNEDFNDGVLILYVNTSHKDTSTELGQLIHDFRCKDHKEWYHTDMTKRAGRLKGDEGSMESWKKRAEEVRADATETAYEEVALTLIKRGKDALEEIAEICHLTLQQVQNLAATVNP